MGDEIGFGTGSPDRRRRPPLAGRAAGAVLVVAVVGYAVATRTAPRAAGPRPTTPVTATPDGPPTAPAPALVEVGEVCPVVTDHRSTLTVSFTLVGRPGAPSRLVSVEPLLPFEGLRPRGTTLRGGTCSEPRMPVPESLGASGAGVLVTFELGLPEECPTAYPVEALVHVRGRDGKAVSQAVHVLNDLDGIAFDACRPAT